MEIDFQTVDHVVAMKKVVEQHISTKCSMCNCFQVGSDFTHFVLKSQKVAITRLAIG